MRILITGINGFIGRPLALALLEKGFEVVGFGRHPSFELSGVKYSQGDVLDKPFVQKMVKYCNAVIHLAGMTSYFELTNHRYEALESIVTGTRNVLDAVRASDGPKRIIYSSTGKVYGKIRALPIDEQHVAEPLNTLGKAKFMAERMIDFYAQDFNQACVLRIFNVYGPHQNEQFLIPTIFKQLKSTREITLGDIHAKRDYVFIDDVVGAFLSALDLTAEKFCQTYNVCSGVASSAQDIVQTIAKLQDREIKVHSKSSLVRNDEMPDEYGSFNLFEKKTGWKPRFSLRDGLAETLRRENLK